MYTRMRCHAYRHSNYRLFAIRAHVSTIPIKSYNAYKVYIYYNPTHLTQLISLTQRISHTLNSHTHTCHILTHTHLTEYSSHTTDLTQLISHNSSHIISHKSSLSHTLTLSHTHSLTQLYIYYNPTHLTQLISLTQRISHTLNSHTHTCHILTHTHLTEYSSHTTDLTQLISHNSSHIISHKSSLSHTLTLSHTHSLTQLISHHLTQLISHLSHISPLTHLISHTLISHTLLSHISSHTHSHLTHLISHTLISHTLICTLCI